jgi:hypothetical protein
MQQRRIAYMRFLGELYSYRLIDSPVIFDTLYLIIGYGHGTPEVSSSVPNFVPLLCFFDLRDIQIDLGFYNQAPITTFQDAR